MKEKGMTELKENERSIILNYLKVHSRKWREESAKYYLVVSLY
jgi:hypothetical protein